MGFDGGSGFVPGSTGGGPPPSASDVMVGKSLFVSDRGHPGGIYEDLSYHFNEIDFAINALTSNDDVIYCYSIQQEINITALPSGIDTLNLVIFGKNSNIEFIQDIAGLEYLNIQTEGDIKFIQKQTSLIFCNIICQNLNTYEQLKTIVCTFNITVYDTLTTAFYFNGSGTQININANKIIGNANITSPSANDKCNISCNTFNGLFFLNINTNTDWKFSLNANRIFYLDPTNTSTGMFTFTANNEVSNISKFVIKCPDIYYYSNSPMIDHQGGIFGFKNCTFKQELVVNEDTEMIRLRKLSVGGNKTVLYLKNCDFNFINSNIVKGLIYLNNAAGPELLVYIENCNFYAAGGDYTLDPTYVIYSNIARDYYGISGNADQNVFDDFEKPGTLTNIAGSPNVQLINYLPQL
jgi:hypothetical protein